MTKANDCTVCSHQIPCGYNVSCSKGHKPRFYGQKHDNPYDTGYGWKRVCSDFALANGNGEQKCESLSGSVNSSSRAEAFSVQPVPAKREY